METVHKKQIGLSVFIILLSAALFASVTTNAIPVSHPAIFIVLLSWLAFWVSSLAITLSLVSRPYAYLCLLTITGLIILFGRFQVEIIAASLLFLALAIAARRVALRELHNRIEYHTRLVFNSSLKYLIMGTLILLTGLVLPYLTGSVLAQETVIPESMVHFLLRPYQPYLRQTLPGGSIDASLEDIVEAQINQQPGAAALSPTERRLYAQQLSQQLSEQLKQKVSGTDNLVTIITDVINNKLRLLIGANPIVAPIIIFALVIVFSRLLIPWLALGPLLLTAALLYLSRRVKLVKISSVSLPVDKLEL